MDGLNRVLAICSIPLFIITLFLTYKFLTIANNKTKAEIRNNELPLITASKEEVKIYPEEDDNLQTNSDQMIYDFVNNNKITYKAKEDTITNDEYTNLPDKKPTPEALETERNLNIPEEEKNINQPDNLKEKEAPKISITKIEKPKKNITKKTGHMLQIGAFSKKENAIIKWQQIINRYPRDFSKVQNQISYTENSLYGGLYKLKIGPFKSEELARKFCRNLRQINISCFYTSIK